MNSFPVMALSHCQPYSSAEKVRVQLSVWRRPGIMCDDVAVRFCHENKQQDPPQKNKLFYNLLCRDSHLQTDFLSDFLLFSPSFFILYSKLYSQPSTQWAALDYPSGPSACKHQVESRFTILRTFLSDRSLISPISVAQRS